MVNQYQNEYKSCSSISALTEYATKLIMDVDFRKSEGEKLQDGIMTEEKFAIEFNNVLATHQSSWHFERDQIDYGAFLERYLDLENSNGYKITKQIAKSLKTEVLRIRTKRQNMIEAYMAALYDKIKYVLKIS